MSADKRGGKREGSGRKPRISKQISYRIPLDLADWLKAKGGSKFLVAILSQIKQAEIDPDQEHQRA